MLVVFEAEGSAKSYKAIKAESNTRNYMLKLLNKYRNSWKTRTDKTIWRYNTLTKTTIELFIDDLDLNEPIINDYNPKRFRIYILLCIL